MPEVIYCIAKVGIFRLILVFSRSPKFIASPFNPENCNRFIIAHGSKSNEHSRIVTKHSLVYADNLLTILYIDSRNIKIAKNSEREKQTPYWSQ